MSLDSFVGLDSGEGMSEAAFEKLRERMAAAAAQIAAIRKEEGKQKKKEDELLKILLKFIQHSHKKELVLLISRALEQNIPAVFILNIVLLGNEEIQEHLQTFIALNPAAPNEKALTFFSPEDQSLPLKLKIEVDNWIKNILKVANEYPHKLLKHAYTIEKTKREVQSSFGSTEYDERKVIKESLIQLTAFVLRDYLEQNKHQEGFEKIKQFSHFILKGILDKTQENLDNRINLEGNTSEPI